MDSIAAAESQASLVAEKIYPQSAYPDDRPNKKQNERNADQSRFDGIGPEIADRMMRSFIGCFFLDCFQGTQIDVAGTEFSLANIESRSGSCCDLDD